jgi:hypothetical protein
VDALPCNIDVLVSDVASIPHTIVLERSDNRASHAHIRVKHNVRRFSQRENKPFNKLHWKLAWVNRLFDVVRFDIGDHPHVTWILAERIARKLTSLRTLEVFLTRILRRHSDRIKIERVVVVLGEPKDRLMATG